MLDPGHDHPGRARCRRRATVFDLVYVPAETPLLAAARARGLRAANGSEMLIAQAAIAFERWTGVAGMADVMREAVAPLLADADGPGLTDAPRDDPRGRGGPGRRRRATTGSCRSSCRATASPAMRAIAAGGQPRARRIVGPGSTRQPADAGRPLDDGHPRPGRPRPGGDLHGRAQLRRAPARRRRPERPAHLRQGRGLGRRARRDAGLGPVGDRQRRCRVRARRRHRRSAIECRAMATSSATPASTTSRRATSGSTATSGCSASRCRASARSGRGS